MYTHLILQLDIDNPHSHYLQYRTGDKGWFSVDTMQSPLTLILAQIVTIKFRFGQEGNIISEPPSAVNEDKTNNGDDDSNKAQSSHEGSTLNDFFASIFLHLMVNEKVDPRECQKAIFIRSLNDYDLDT
jgi:hypothetical protein